jgi:ribosome assembly protein YihI (activator of Der GTPase)
VIDKEQFYEWKRHPMTEEVFAALEEARAELLDRLGSGNTLSETADQTHGQTARLVGNIEGLNQILNISFLDEEEASDREK